MEDGAPGAVCSNVSLGLRRSPQSLHPSLPPSPTPGPRPPPTLPFTQTQVPGAVLDEAAGAQSSWAHRWRVGVWTEMNK